MFKDLRIQQFKTTSNNMKQSKTISNNLKLRNGRSPRNSDARTAKPSTKLNQETPQA